MGDGDLSGDGAESGQQRCVLWSLSAHLWSGRACIVVCAAKILSKTLCDVPTVGGHLLCARVWRQRSAGMEMGDALVGLQWIFSESERPNMSGGSGVFWVGRHVAQLLSAAILHEGVSSDQAQMAADHLWHSAGGLYSGYYLLCGKTTYRPGHCVVNVPAWFFAFCRLIASRQYLTLPDRYVLAF